jgi:hypothetical protein
VLQQKRSKTWYVCDLDLILKKMGENRRRKQYEKIA